MAIGDPLTRMISVRVTDAVYDHLVRACRAEGKVRKRKMEMADFLRARWEDEMVAADAARKAAKAEAEATS